jgi:hypothetical protein
MQNPAFCVLLGTKCRQSKAMLPDRNLQSFTKATSLLACKSINRHPAHCVNPWCAMATAWPVFPVVKPLALATITAWQGAACQLQT